MTVSVQRYIVDTTPVGRMLQDACFRLVVGLDPVPPEHRYRLDSTADALFKDTINQFTDICNCSQAEFGLHVQSYPVMSQLTWDAIQLYQSLVIKDPDKVHLDRIARDKHTDMWKEIAREYAVYTYQKIMASVLSYTEVNYVLEGATSDYIVLLTEPKTAQYGF